MTTHRHADDDDFGIEELRILREAYEREAQARDMAEHALYLREIGRGSIDDLALALRELLDATE